MKFSKYGNKKCIFNGFRFDSLKEMNRYVELKLIQKSGAIRGLTLQPRFLLQPSFKWQGKTERKIEYVADFSYWMGTSFYIEDVKSTFTKKNPVYRIKKKMLLHKINSEGVWVDGDNHLSNPNLIKFIEHD